MISCGHLKREELYRTLRDQILSGRYKHGLQIPPETKLTEEFKVSRDTLRAALKKLEEEGLLIRVRPKGTFVNAPGLDHRLIVALLQPGNDIAEPRNYILPGMQKAALEHGFEIELCPIDFVNETMSMFHNKEIAGFVIFGGRYTGEEPYVKFLRKSGRPVIMAGCHAGDVRTTGFAGLRPDRKTAWMDGIRALKKAGHTRIATLTLPYLQGYEDDPAAYREALRAEDLFDPKLILYTEYKYQSIRDALIRLLKMNHPPTAVMCYSDFFAMLLLRAAEELSVRIPEDLCVMGFSGYPGARFLNPPLATVELNYFRMGKTAVELIANASEWFGNPSVAVPDVIIFHKVILRESAMIRRVESMFAWKAF
ncbi:MAG: HTH-type transcriptional repressor CytR [Lentisphaerae bacterium ADurb.Bin242]|nr:MAG: HTH-type transcriptional repressor CytR [Lentisphaerae bacterium ADurb.Bin242]